MRFQAPTLGILTLLLVTCAAWADQTTTVTSHTQDKAVGNWHGLLDTGAGKLTIILNISGEESGLTGFLETPDQAPGKKIPITTVASVENQLHLEFQSLSASYEADWREAGQSWDGVWKQSGIELPLGLEAGLPVPKASIKGMDGVWESSVNRNDQVIRLIVAIVTGDRGTTVSFAAPDFGVSGLVVQDFGLSDRAVQFAVPATGAQFRGQVSEGGHSMTGTWTYPNQPDVELTFVRTQHSEILPPVRPQMPQEPFGYRVEEVAIHNHFEDDVVLAGTLTLPEGPGPFPAAILISGSGPQDRDETVFGHKPFAVLADHLTKEGIAVLRYDDRGCGKSTGRFGNATSGDFATDANSVCRYLLSRKEINPEAIGFVGHSEGGIVAPLAAIDNDEIDFVVMLAGPGTNLTEISVAQRRMFRIMQGASDEEVEHAEPILRRIYAAIASSGTREDAKNAILPILTPSALQALGTSEAEKDLTIQELTRDWLRYLLKYDPFETLSSLDVPVLALNGDLDRSVPADPNLAAIRAALRNNPDATTMKFPGINHMFQTAETGAIGEYADIPETFAPEALEAISEWINQRF